MVTDDDAVAEEVRLLRSHGMTAPTWERHREGSLGYDVVALGFNYRIDEPRAALATASLPALDGANARRRELAAAYRERLAEIEGVAPAMPVRDGAESAQHLFTVVLDRGHDRDGVRRELAEGGIQTSLHYPPVHRFSAYEAFRADLPLTDDYARRAITLPLFPQMSEEQLELVVGALSSALAKGG